jgi:hypothetical protein
VCVYIYIYITHLDAILNCVTFIFWNRSLGVKIGGLLFVGTEEQGIGIEVERRKGGKESSKNEKYVFQNLALIPNKD